MLRLLPGFLLKGVHAVEHDFVGVVVDPNGSEFNVGDEVVCCNPLGALLSCSLLGKKCGADHNKLVSAGTVLSTSWGALAQYTRTMASTTVLRPKNVTPTQSSGKPFSLRGATLRSSKGSSSRIWCLRRSGAGMRGLRVGGC